MQTASISCTLPQPARDGSLLDLTIAPYVSALQPFSSECQCSFLETDGSYMKE